jgi:hypothetical protein
LSSTWCGVRIVHGRKAEASSSRLSEGGVRSAVSLPPSSSFRSHLHTTAHHTPCAAVGPYEHTHTPRGLRRTRPCGASRGPPPWP